MAAATSASWAIFFLFLLLLRCFLFGWLVARVRGVLLFGIRLGLIQIQSLPMAYGAAGVLGGYGYVCIINRALPVALAHRC